MDSAFQAGIEKLIEKIIYITYLEENFSSYPGNDKAGVLKYEIEYLLSGKLKDKDNLSSVVLKIMLLRLAFNMVYLISDAASRAKAHEAALLLVGFTGFAALVSVVKYLILSIWSIEAALVETAAILSGKKVAIIVTGKTINVAFEELLSMTKSVIKKKSENTNESKLGLTYSDYLRLFILCEPLDELSYYTMDLIQENIKAMYNDKFYIKNCITSYKVNAAYELPQMFLNMPFISGKYSYDKGSFKINSIIEEGY